MRVLVTLMGLLLSVLLLPGYHCLKPVTAYKPLLLINLGVPADPIEIGKRPLCMGIWMELLHLVVD